MPTERSIYQDIAVRTGGDIYIGVVGPVRTGKSTFIKKFMETMVLPQIENDDEKARATDEIPQSASGKTVMTTEPKFVPDKAVKIPVSDALSANIKLIDCVGFLVPGAEGAEDENGQRAVHTPWSENALPFEEAAELGTKKVIAEHSTVAVMVTCDGSIAQIPRENYADAEERVVRELKKSGKPFVILLNSASPENDAAKQLAAQLQEKYRTPVLTENLFDLSAGEIQKILEKIVLEFPAKEIRIRLPEWVMTNPQDHRLKKDILETVTDPFSSVRKTGEVLEAIRSIPLSPLFEEVKLKESDLGTGCLYIDTELPKSLFFKILSDESHTKIEGEKDLAELVKNLTEIKAKYDKIAKALDEVNETGYGIVTPEIEDLTLEEPEIVKQSGGYGVKLSASAPSIHMIKADIRAEISPIVGSERQSEDIVKFLLQEFEEDPAKIWHSNLFGKSLFELVSEGVNSKLEHIPKDARTRLSETMQKIINDGCNGLICIIL